MQARLCELGERENAGRKRAQVYPLRYSEHVFSRRRRDLVAQRAAAQGIFEMASRTGLKSIFCCGRRYAGCDFVKLREKILSVSRWIRLRFSRSFSSPRRASRRPRYEATFETSSSISPIAWSAHLHRACRSATAAKHRSKPFRVRHLHSCW